MGRAPTIIRKGKSVRLGVPAMLRGCDGSIQGVRTRVSTAIAREVAAVNAMPDSIHAAKAQATKPHRTANGQSHRLLTQE